MAHALRPLAVVTGAASGVGLEIARLAGARGHDLVIAADGGPLAAVADDLRRSGVNVQAVAVDLATGTGVDLLDLAIAGRPVEVLVAHAGHGPGPGFLDEDFGVARQVIDTDVTGLLDVIHRVGRGMRARRRGRILITGSVAAGACQAVCNATAAFVDAFSHALRDELQDTGVTVTCLRPGAGEPDVVGHAHLGFDALMAGDADVVVGRTARPPTGRSAAEMLAGLGSAGR